MPSFSNLQNNVREHARQIDELITQVYCVHHLGDDWCGICYYDQTSHQMGFTLLLNNTECRLLADVPYDIITQYSEFINKVRLWETGEIESFPYELTIPEDLDEEPEQLLK